MGKKAKKRMRKAALRLTQALAVVALESIGTLAGGLMQSSIERGRALMNDRRKRQAKAAKAAESVEQSSGRKTSKRKSARAGRG